MSRSGPDPLVVREAEEAVAMMHATVSRLIQFARLVALSDANGNERDPQYLGSRPHFDRLLETVAEIPVETLLALCEAIADDKRAFLERLRPHLHEVARMDGLETAEAMIQWMISRDRPN